MKPSGRFALDAEADTRPRPVLSAQRYWSASPFWSDAPESTTMAIPTLAKYGLVPFRRMLEALPRERSRAVTSMFGQMFATGVGVGVGVTTGGVGNWVSELGEPPPPPQPTRAEASAKAITSFFMPILRSLLIAINTP